MLTKLKVIKKNSSNSLYRLSQWMKCLTNMTPSIICTTSQHRKAHTLPSHCPVFWFLLKPGLHWHIALAFVWLQIASSPHGFVFFPHTSPLETTNKNRSLITLLNLSWLLGLCFEVQQLRVHPNHLHTEHNTPQTCTITNNKTMEDLCSSW